MTRTHNIGRLSADELAELDNIKADLEALTGRMSRPDCVMKIARWVRRDMQTRRAYRDDVPSIMAAVAVKEDK